MRKANIMALMVWLLLGTLTLPPAHRLQAEEKGRCAMCGMDLSKYMHTLYRVKTVDGREFKACGVQCGLMIHLQLGKNFASATATDFITGRPINAQDAFFVFKSSVITDMSPGFIAFSSRKNAEKFVKGFGGKIVTYSEALELCKGLRH